jgi:hypothetical protein
MYISSTAHLWTFYTTVLQFLHSLHFDHKQHIIHDGFFSMKKVGNSANFAAGRIINRRTHRNSLCGFKNTRWPVMWWFTRQWATWHYLARASSPPLLHQLPKINGGYFPNSPHKSAVTSEGAGYQSACSMCLFYHSKWILSALNLPCTQDTPNINFYIIKCNFMYEMHISCSSLSVLSYVHMLNQIRLRITWKK